MKLTFSIYNFVLLLFVFSTQAVVNCKKEVIEKKPNILFCIADDWGWPHAGVYGDHVVKTPTFDKLAKEGILFEKAFVSSPSCTPSRGAILTGKHFWQLGEGGNLWSTLDVDIPVYPLLLEESGYFVGSWRKSWGPGDIQAGGYDSIGPAGKIFPEGFGQFLQARPDKKPFCFWFGASDPHRIYEKGSGVASGIDLEAIELPKFFADTKEIRSDIADYYFEVQRFDSDVGAAIHLLDSLGELENTLIVVTGDHGMPFPRCKANLYDMGVRVPLVMRWGNKIVPNTRMEDFVSLIDMAPTFLDLADVNIPQQMIGKSLKPMLLTSQNETTTSHQDYVVFGRERHTPAQKAPSLAGYPSRGIRTKDHLYIQNFFPDRWPVGVPQGASHPMGSFSDCDGGPTKTFLIENQDDPRYKPYFDWCFGQRPAEELYVIAKDQFQLTNVANDSSYLSIKNSLSAQLLDLLMSTGDPRVVSSDVDFDNFPYRAPYELNSGE